jgi:hypothetical protein
MPACSLKPWPSLPGCPSRLPPVCTHSCEHAPITAHERPTCLRPAMHLFVRVNSTSSSPGSNKQRIVQSAIMSPNLDRAPSVLPDTNELLKRSQLLSNGYQVTKRGLKRPEDMLDLQPRQKYLAALRPPVDRSGNRSAQVKTHPPCLPPIRSVLASEITNSLDICACLIGKKAQKRVLSSR